MGLALLLIADGVDEKGESALPLRLSRNLVTQVVVILLYRSKQR